MGKNVAVFVDVANIFYAAKAAGVDIDYVTLLKAAIAGRDFVRAYAYTGLDPDNENQRNFHSFLARHGYKVVSKDIRKYGDGKVKANLDIELVVDMLKTARNLDVAIVVSGDGDFAPAIRAVQEMGVRVEVISFRGNTSSDLIEAADIFTDITALARVERSGRSGRRVADDEFDMSMTEVPDKQTEGSGRSRSRGGRGRSRPAEEGAREPVAATAGADRPARGRGVARGADRVADRVGPDRNGAGTMTVLPGEKLSRIRSGAGAAPEVAAEAAGLDEIEDFDDIEVFEETAIAGEPGGGETADGETADGEPRRRRRRGGRGRGRGRTRAEEAAAAGVEPALVAERPSLVRAEVDEADEEEDVPVAPRGARPTPFGSIWDSQLGVPTAPRASGLTPLPDDEDFDEPEVPEYLLAERRRGARGGGQFQPGRGGGGQRGGGNRSAYAAALDRERYGGAGRGSAGGGGFPQPGPRTGGGQGGQGGPGGPGRGPGRPQRHDRVDRPVGPPGNRVDRVERIDRPDRVTPMPPRPDRGRNEEWSEVPPEIEELLRAQLAGRLRAPAPGARQDAPAASAGGENAAAVDESPATARGRGRGRRPAAAVEAEAVAPAEAPAPTAPRVGARGRSRGPALEAAAEAGSLGATLDVAAVTPDAPRRGRRPTTPEPVADAATEVPAAAAPAKRGRRPAAAAPGGATGPAADGAATAEAAAEAAPRRRTTRTRATPEATTSSEREGEGTAADAGAPAAARRGRRKAPEAPPEG